MSTDSPIPRGESIVSSAPPQVRELVERFDRRARLTTVGRHEKAALERQIDATDRQTCPDEGRIDQLVYELYGLTEEEIRIVEEATK